MIYKIHCNWLPPNNFLFQVANVWLVLSYLCPPTLKGLIFLRLSLGFAGLFFALWGWTVLCAPDTFVWNLLFFVGNFLHLGYILFSMRTKKFNDDMEEVYRKIFQQLKIPRHQFNLLAEAANKTEIVPAGKLFVIDGITESKSLWILLKGRIYVRKHGKLVHIIEECQFINSPEWVISENDPYLFEVTMICHTECKIVSWDRKTMLNILQKNIYLKTVVDSVISKDVAQKLFSMNTRIKHQQGFAHSIYSLNELGNSNQRSQEPSNEFESDDDDGNVDIVNYRTKLLDDFYANEKETTL